MTAQLSPNPAAVRILRTDETTRLRARYPDLPRTPRDCKTCRGTGTFRWYADGSRTEIADYECDCDEQFLLHRWLLNSGVELHYQRLAWTDAATVETAALDVAGDYINNVDHYIAAGLGLVFHGGYGTGKTLLSSLLLKSLLGRGVDGYFATFQDLLDTYTKGWRDDEQATWFDKRVRNAGILVIDDIGRENHNRSAVVESALDSVLRSRVSADRPTLITTNKSIEDIGTLYSGNAVSLLSESSLVYRFTGADFRPRLNDRNRTEAQNRLTRPLVLG